MDTTDINDASGSEDMDMSNCSEEVLDTRRTGAKRKQNESSNDAATTKRPKIDTTSTKEMDASKKLPDAVWQRIFISLPPAMLFRCTRVCPRFKHLLTNVKHIPPRPNKLKFDLSHPEPATQLIESESIWIHSRRLTYPSLPRPLNGHSEAQMLRLITQRTCCNCKQRFPPAKTTHALNGGPGASGIRSIWPFRRAVCGRCLLQLTITDVELLQERSPLPSGALRRGLAYAFLSKDIHIISEHNARNTNIQGVSKIFLRADIDDIIVEYHDAKALGEGTVEEWLKGLDDKGKLSMSDPLRWCRWEDSLPNGTVLAEYMKGLDPSSFAPQPARVLHPLPQPVEAISFTQAVAPPQHRTHEHTPARQPREPKEAAENMRLRREIIDERCMQLQPPLTPEVLQYNPAYVAALKIPLPMDDAAWELLKPRIEQDRELAEHLHYEKSQQQALLGVRLPSGKDYVNALAIQNKEIDQKWEEARAPIRAKLSDIADEVINSKWLRSAPLTITSAPIFAADVLISTFNGFYDQESAHNSSSSAAAATLALDDLRWVFDRKVRTPAEALTRNLFVCSECYTNEDVRWFPFEGLIQHYGAKHTTDFSRGNIIVHWQSATWPADPPFVSDLSKILRPQPRRSSHNHDNRVVKSYGPPRRNSQRSPLERYHAQTPVHTGHPSLAKERERESANARVPSVEDTQLTKIGADAADIWNKLAGVTALSGSIRMNTVLQLCRARFERHFNVFMPLELFTKAIVMSPSLQPLKDEGDLACRFCPPPLEEAGQPYNRRSNPKGYYHIAGLLTHYKLHHAQQQILTAWSNLVAIPDNKQVLELLTTPGMNDQKLALISEAHPGVFPVPLPHIGLIPGPGKDSGLAARLVQRQLGTLNKKGKKKKGQHKDTDGHGHAHAEEYDPRNPTLSNKQEDRAPVDLSKFDTDAQRPPSVAAVGSNGQMSLTAETLDAIDRLRSYQLSFPAAKTTAINPTQSTATITASQQAEAERPPSPFADRPASAAASAQPDPDIAAIIKGIKQQNSAAGQPAVPTPRPFDSFTQPSSFGAAVAGPPSTPAFTTFGQPSGFAAAIPPPHRRESHTPAAPDTPNYWFQGYNAPSRNTSPAHQPAPSAGQDLLGALTRNAHAFQASGQYPPGHFDQARASMPPAYYSQANQLPQFLQFQQGPPPVPYGIQPPAPPQYTQQYPQHAPAPAPPQYTQQYSQHPPVNPPIPQHPQYGYTTTAFPQPQGQFQPAQNAQAGMIPKGHQSTQRGRLLYRDGYGNEHYQYQ